AQRHGLHMPCPSSEMRFACHPIGRIRWRQSTERRIRDWTFPVVPADSCPSSPSTLLFRMLCAELSQFPGRLCLPPALAHIPIELPGTCLGDGRHRQAVPAKIPTLGPTAWFCGTRQLPPRTAPWPNTENRGDRRLQAREGRGEHKARFLSKIPGSCPSL